MIANSESSEEAVQPLEGVPLDTKQLEEAEERFRSVTESLAHAQAHIDKLHNELSQGSSQNLEITKENERLIRELEQMRKEFDLFRESTEEKLEQNHIFLREYQQTINEQRGVVEAKQLIVEQLEGKVRDLTYEIKTLLQLAEKVQNDKPQTVVPISLGGQRIAEAHYPYRPQVQTNVSDTEGLKTEDRVSVSVSAINQLRHCLNIAQKITGASYQGQRLPRGPDLSPDSNALEMRRLFDGLRTETTSALWVYSLAENKVLFANQAVKPLLGWPPDKFMQNFSEIINDAQIPWQEAIAQLSYKTDCQALLQMQSKSGQAISIQCHLGMVPTGLFKGHIIGIAYPG
jgi:PAS domain-containing protein